MGADRQMTWDEVVERNTKLNAKIKQQKEEIDKLKASSQKEKTNKPKTFIQKWIEAVKSVEG